MTCPRTARLELYEVRRGELGQQLLKLGVYCIEHFHAERARVRAEGRHTGVSILLEIDPATTCRAEIDPPPAEPKEQAA